VFDGEQLPEGLNLGRDGIPEVVLGDNGAPDVEMDDTADIKVEHDEL
jgi:hypothetical protein